MNDKIHKKCPYCGEVKLYSDFNRNKSSYDGYCSWCRVCDNEKHREYRTIHSEEIKEKKKAYYKRTYKKNPELNRQKHFKRCYGITIEQAEEIYKRGCAICRSVENLCIDHCHKTGSIRDCLCSNCNKGLGLFKDSIDLLDKAKEYLCQH